MQRQRLDLPQQREFEPVKRRNVPLLLDRDQALGFPLTFRVCLVFECFVIRHQCILVGKVLPQLRVHVIRLLIVVSQISGGQLFVRIGFALRDLRNFLERIVRQMPIVSLGQQVLREVDCTEGALVQLLELKVAAVQELRRLLFIVPL